jgi:hypothetical protein
MASKARSLSEKLELLTFRTIQLLDHPKVNPKSDKKAETNTLIHQDWLCKQ